MRAIIKKHLSSLMMIVVIFMFSLLSHCLSKKPKGEKSLDSLVPQGFVLIPVQIFNGKDIVGYIGSHGIVDLYSLSQNETPQEKVGKSLKIISPQTQDSEFVVLIPEKEVPLFFEHSPPFYAVIKNPQKQASQIHKKRVKKHLTIIEST